MKQAMNKTKMITMGLFAFCAMGLSNTAFAAVKTGDPAELTFIGNVQNQPVFQLNLNNNEADEYYISIKDGNRNLMYSEKVKGTNLFRRYRLAIDEADLNSSDFGIRVEVTSAKTHKTQVYKISSNTLFIENFVVAKP